MAAIQHLLMTQPVFLLSHRGALGDFVLTFPLLDQLNNHFPDHRFVLLGYPHLGRLAQHLGLLNDVLDCDNFLYMGFYNGGYIPEPLLPAQKGIIWSKPNPELQSLLAREHLSDVYIFPPFPTHKTSHVVTHHLSALKRFGLSPTEPLLTYRFSNTKQRSGAVLIHPGAGSPEKVYDIGFYLFIANEFKKRGHTNIRFLIGPAEQSVKSAFAHWPTEEFPNLVDLAKYLSDVSLFIGNDSGVSHLSALCGTPTIAFYKHSSQMQWGIRGAKAMCIDAQNEAIAMAKLEKRLALKHT